MHCYITYFFQLLLGLETSPVHNYTAMSNWSSNIDGVPSVFNLRELFIPINKGDVHWLLLRVQMVEKPIETWDSLGHTETNPVYLQLVCRYLYVAQNHGAQRDQVALEEWSIDWSCFD